jgi:hypothetical protein
MTAKRGSWKRWGLVGVALVAVVVGASGGPAAAYEIDYATYDAVVTDVQGVVTEVTDLGFWAGANILTARRGEAVVEIPLRKVQVIEMGAYHAEKGVYACTVTTRAGAGKPAKSIPCQVERMEGQRTLGGDSDLGAFRIRLQQIRRLELLGLSHASP